MGTLYQYDPNKQSLPFVVLERPTDKVAAALEGRLWAGVSQAALGIIRQLREDFVDAKIERTDIFVAFYSIVSDVGRLTLAKSSVQRSRKATGGDVSHGTDEFVLQRSRFQIHWIGT